MNDFSIKGGTPEAQTALIRWLMIRSIAIWLCVTAVVCCLVLRCS